jgi:hypothetical protein
MARKASDIPSVNAENAKVLAELVIDPATPEALRIKILNKLLEASEGSSFFRTMFEEKLSYAACPDCGHENHWLIPEDELNKMGYVSHEKDQRVPLSTTSESCQVWEEACAKKKVTI